MTDNLHAARVEAAAHRLWLDWNGPIGIWDSPKSISSVVKERYRTIASNALNAADKLVTVEKIADEIAGHPIGSGYYQTTISIYEAQEIAAGIHALLTGEEA